jgi:hypothetical protein
MANIMLLFITVEEDGESLDDISSITLRRGRIHARLERTTREECNEVKKLVG